MDFAAVAWWGYLFTVVCGVGFGVFQSLILKRALQKGKMNPILYGLKFILWAMALIAAALIAIPVLLVFAVTASLTLVILSALLYRKAQREAR